ncbi:Uncharacterised protein [Vibrio cholerae]|uniref:Uncharacterized protein n=1 Tax=Vibrio cholerae TaxID=666 RepID=A0A655WJP4_VIBCL|nr:Uncharacterised protein [Vibrio cholerae]
MILDTVERFTPASSATSLILAILEPIGSQKLQKNKELRACTILPYGSLHSARQLPSYTGVQRSRNQSRVIRDFDIMRYQQLY